MELLAKRKADLDEKVKTLEAEKASLIAEIEALKAISVQQEKAATLEADVAELKQEKKALEETVTPTPSCEETAAEPAAETVSEEAPPETSEGTPMPAPEATPAESAEASKTETPATSEENPCEPCGTCEEEPSE